MSRRLRALAVALATVLALAGCTGIPTSGPVERVAAAPGRVNHGVEIAPAPPARGAAPVEIVEGFLHAMAAWQPDYRVARAYLTPDAASTWDPDAGVRIYAEGTSVLLSDRGALLSAPLVGEVDARGGFRQQGGRIEHDFGLVRDAEGQWRIATPPSGLVVSEYLFTSMFVRVPVYFFASGNRWLVPDSRYFPRGQQALERAARALVAGPTDWTAPLVDRAVPAAILPHVTQSASGLVDVTLDVGASPLPDDRKLAFATQLTWTLRAFDTVTALQLRDANGQPWNIPGFEGRPIPVARPTFADADPQFAQTTSQVFAIRDGRLVRVVEGTSGIETLGVAPAAHDLATASVRPDGQLAAVVSSTREVATLASLTENAADPVLTSSGLRRPHWSRLGELWLPTGRPTLLLASGKSVAEVAVGGLGEGQVTNLRVSPDGARLVLVVKRPTGHAVLGVAAIVRTSGRVSVQGWNELPIRGVSTDQLEVLDAGWRSPDSLLALVSDARGTTVVSLRPDGSEPAVIGPSSAGNLVELAVAPGVSPLVRSDDGHVYRYSADYRWAAYVDAVTHVGYAG